MRWVGTKRRYAWMAAMVTLSGVWESVRHFAILSSIRADFRPDSEDSSTFWATCPRFPSAFRAIITLVASESSWALSSVLEGLHLVVNQVHDELSRCKIIWKYQLLNQSINQSMDWSNWVKQPILDNFINQSSNQSNEQRAKTEPGKQLIKRKDER